MLCLGIESTAHTFGCSVINSENDDRNKNDGYGIIRSTRYI